MDTESQLLTTFNTLGADFVSSRCHSVSINHSTFSVLDGCIFGDLNEGTHVIADDVKIHGDSKSTHNLHLLGVLNQCRKIGLKLNADKCIFKATSIPSLDVSFQVKEFNQILQN